MGPKRRKRRGRLRSVPDWLIVPNILFSCIFVLAHSDGLFNLERGLAVFLYQYVISYKYFAEHPQAMTNTAGIDGLSSGSKRNARCVR